jgi:hypothetical protein
MSERHMRRGVTRSAGRAQGTGRRLDALGEFGYLGGGDGPGDLFRRGEREGDDEAVGAAEVAWIVPWWAVMVAAAMARPRPEPARGDGVPR